MHGEGGGNQGNAAAAFEDDAALQRDAVARLSNAFGMKERGLQRSP